MGGVRPRGDIEALLENIAYAWRRAKVVVLEEELAALGVSFEFGGALAAGVTGREDSARQERARQDAARRDDPTRAYKVLVIDPVGLRVGKEGRADVSA